MNKTFETIDFVYELCEWYRHNQRDLPFRKTNDPYAIFISELMLQQTQVDTMLSYYDRFMDAFPTVNALANAPKESVLKLWEGLGYYRRANYVHETAKIVTNQFDGHFPKTYKELIKLPGVGRYTAGAIMSIAYLIPTPAIDGNVFRVITRLLTIPDDISTTTAYHKVEQHLITMLKYDNPSDFTQGLMELGALICIPQPRCSDCPVNQYCFAYKQNNQLSFPNKPKQKQKINETHIVFIYQDNSFFLLNQRPSKGLLANMMEFPQYLTSSLSDAIDLFNQQFDTTIVNHDFITNVKHVFTHKVWHLEIYRIETESKISHKLYDIEHLPMAMSKAHIKIKNLL